MIYYVEDDDNIRELVVYTLTQMGLPARGYRDGAAFDAAMAAEKPDLVLLDIMLPNEDGMSILKRLRADQDTQEIPIIMVTAKGAEFDKVTGLDTGADDYITKPFDIEELLARIRVCLRKRSPAKETAKILSSGPLALDPARHEVHFGQTPVTLTQREFALLQVMMENRSIVLSREVLLEKVWGYEYAGETNVVDVYIRYLRAKIDDTFGVKYIHTVRGVGYVFRDA